MSWANHRAAERRRIRLLWGLVLLLALVWVVARCCGTQEAVSPPAGTGGWLDEGGR